MPKHLNILLTIVCLMIIVPPVLGVCFWGTVFVLTLVLEFFSAITSFMSHLEVPFAIVGLSVVAWLVIRSRRSPAPPAPPAPLIP